MEHVLKRAWLGLVLLGAAACRNESELTRREKRALEASVAESKDTVHKLNMKELEGGELTQEEKAGRQRLKEQAAEDENGGNSPEPPPGTPDAAPEASVEEPAAPAP